METNNIRPFLIGICGGSLSGKQFLSQKIAEKIGSEYKVCQISLADYYLNLSEEDYKRKEKYNFDKPEALDFDSLYSDLSDILNKKVIKLPKYDINTCKREDNKVEVKPSDVIILEGIFAFYDDRIRNLIDLKIFIDVDKDIQLSRIICRDVFKKNIELKTSIQRYHKFIKPSYNKFILPTRKYADIILQKVISRTSAIEIISEYLKMQLNKTMKKEKYDLFSFNYEIIDPKYQYYDGKILVENERIFVSFIKEVFQDFIISKLERELIPYIQEKMIKMLNSLLIRYTKKKKGDNILPKIDLLICDGDDIDKYNNFKGYSEIAFFKPIILSEKDIDIPKKILELNKKCNLTIFSIFLSPKYVDLLLSKEINTILFSTIYFSDFFNKFDEIIKKDDTIFNEKELKQLFKEKIKNQFDCQDE